MAKLTLSALILGERSQVYEYVTIYGSQGPTDLRSFREIYGTVIGQEDSTMITRDEEELDPITWNCTFDYPTERLMEAINHVFIIAEAGVNHNASIEKAIKMIHVAKEGGADAIKFQTAVTKTCHD